MPGILGDVMKTFTLMLSFVLWLAALHSRAADSATESFQKGLFEEEANHNFDAAIKAYQSVISQFDDQRKIAATAVFRLAECYRKLGKTNEAKAQYTRVLREFSDQTELAQLSRSSVAVPAAGDVPQNLSSGLG